MISNLIPIMESSSSSSSPSSSSTTPSMTSLDLDAMYQLGMHLFHGSQWLTDDELAVRYLEGAAEKGHAPSLFQMSIICGLGFNSTYNRYGLRGKQDVNRGIELFQRAAALGNASAIEYKERWLIEGKHMEKAGGGTFFALRRTPLQVDDVELKGTKWKPDPRWPDSFQGMWLTSLYQLNKYGCPNGCSNGNVVTPLGPSFASLLSSSKLDIENKIITLPSNIASWSAVKARHLQLGGHHFYQRPTSSNGTSYSLSSSSSSSAVIEWRAAQWHTNMSPPSNPTGYGKKAPLVVSSVSGTGGAEVLSGVMMLDDSMFMVGYIPFYHSNDIASHRKRVFPSFHFALPSNLVIMSE
jgi:hypothetical protein